MLQHLSRKRISLKHWFALTLICVAPLTAQAPQGTSPRAAATDYAAHTAQDNVQIGAVLLTKKELQKIFVTNVDICCVVVEVAVFPQKNNLIKVSAADFTLRPVGSDLATRSSSAKDVAASLQLGSKEAYHAHGPIVTKTEEVGYGRTTGKAPNDPVDPPANGIYVREGVGVGVGVGKETSGSTAGGAGTQQAMETELSQKALPEVSSDKPVAGYLYFFIPKKNKGYELVYTVGGKKVVLPLK